MYVYLSKEVFSVLWQVPKVWCELTQQDV